MLYKFNKFFYHRDMKKKIGFIGLGVMGASMSAHLQNNGLELFVYNRTKSKADNLIKNGATWCDTPKEVAEKSDILFSIVGFPNDVEEVYLGPNGVIEGLHEGLICCDMTTTKPSLMVKIANIFKNHKVSFADAPVSGGDVGARNATLSFMVGSDDETYEALYPYFSMMGKTINHNGSVGAGQHTKMCNQITIAGTMIGVTEALVYAAKAGLDLNTMLNTISKGAAGCWTLDNLAPRVVNKNFDPGFMIEHFVKDMKIALEEADNMGIALPGLALVKQLYTALINQGYGKNGTQALVKALESLNGEKLF